ncbi:hypothetical protein QYE76_070209 [Lolium multiflorum]|uniref:CASP-like protein n=1 Tax=Lolium multiflorum TaxID=4521 RepID=A0AAD8SIR7_LOLMU|nr:hypothetical protein QYE76_070209 [Lolium multiflorum]
MARSHGLAVATLVLRIFALALLVASIVLIATAKIYQPFNPSLVAPPNFTFQDRYAYQYLLSAGVIGCAYTMLALVFAAINVGRRKMVRGSEGVFFICADAVCSVIIATGAAAGLGVAVQYQEINRLFLDSPDGADYKKFFDQVDASCALLLAAALCTLLIIGNSAYTLAN